LDRVVGAEGGSLLERVANAVPADAASWVFLGAWGGAFALLIARRRVNGAWRTALALTVAALFAVAVPAGFLVAAQAYVAGTIREGVVMKQTLEARELPAAQAKVSFEVHAGLKVRVLDAEGSFVRIRLPNGLVGWADKAAIAEI
jgi:hypothetical protein